MAEKTDRELLEETHETVIILKTVVLGANGDKGLHGTVQEQGRELFSLKKAFWTLIGILVGSGVLAGSVITLN